MRTAIAHIIAGITTLNQYLEQQKNAPETLVPPKCPHCGFSKLYKHGDYTRKPNRLGSNGHCQDVIVIYRYRCTNSSCRRTCSALPEFMSPRRWYCWPDQEKALREACNASSLYSLEINSSSNIPIQTIKRWWKRLHSRFSQHSTALCANFPELSRVMSDIKLFWRKVLGSLSLSQSMYIIYQSRLTIP